MTVYRLPEILGGGELEASTGFESGEVPNTPSFIGFCTEGEWFWVSKHLLTEVNPLPPEPDFAAVVRDRLGRAWQHVEYVGRGNWCSTVDDLGCEWEELHRDFGPLVALVEDPFAVPVELPWIDGPVSAGPLGGPHKKIELAIHNEYAEVTPARARELARALWAAADAAEGTS